jgi:hypothetical protein
MRCATAQAQSQLFRNMETSRGWPDYERFSAAVA